MSRSKIVCGGFFTPQGLHNANRLNSKRLDVVVREEIVEPRWGSRLDSHCNPGWRGCAAYPGL